MPHELINEDDDFLVKFQYADYLIDTGRAALALPVLDSLEQIFPEDMFVKQKLLSCYEATRDWEKKADVFERCFEVAPALLAKKDLYKSYKKACKKAKRIPIK